MVTINIPLDERTWRCLRDIAEEHRTGGRASVSGVIRRAVDEWLAVYQSSDIPREQTRPQPAPARVG